MIDLIDRKMMDMIIIQKNMMDSKLIDIVEIMIALDKDENLMLNLRMNIKEDIIMIDILKINRVDLKETFMDLSEILIIDLLIESLKEMSLYSLHIDKVIHFEIKKLLKIKENLSKKNHMITQHNSLIKYLNINLLFHFFKHSRIAIIN
jgi:hypothetical protein